MNQTRSIWKIPLVKELAIILLLKLIILISIKAFWFNEPTVPVDGTDKVSERLLGTTPNHTPTEEIK